jgi:23S rRNA pseudouridine1911/1915/1917 synthase
VRKKARKKKPETRKAETGARPVIRFADAQVVVVEKPAGLTTMRHPEEAAEFGPRAKRFLPPTLADLLPNLLAIHEVTKGRKEKGVKERNNFGGKRRSPPLPFSPSPRRFFLRAVHRLDKETSGLVVFARTPEAARHLGRQFREHSIERRYLAVVRGKACAGKIESWLVRDRGDGRRGSALGGMLSRPQEKEVSTPRTSVGRESMAPQRAVTHVRVLENLGDFTLVECRLETGRTHQVRIHLGEAGTPICGERVYDRPLNGRPYPDSSHARRLALHATRLDFNHPMSGRRMTFTSPFPEDLALWIGRIGK